MNAKQVLTRSMGMLVFFWLLAGLGAAPVEGSDAPAMPQAQYPPTTELISVAWDGSSSDHGAGNAAISADGRFVAFSSESTNIVNDDTNNYSDVFVRDRQAGQTVRISVGIGGAEANGPSTNPTISADGRYVAYLSYANNLVPTDTNGVTDIFLADRDADANGIFDESEYVNTTLVSIATNGDQGNGHSGFSTPFVSSDGRFVTFSSAATNFVEEPIGTLPRGYLRAVQANQTTLLTVRTDDHITLSAWVNNISDDGNLAVFTSEYWAALPCDGNHQLYLRNVQAEETVCLSVTPDGQGDANNLIRGAISADGRFVVMTSSASNLVADDTNGFADIFIRPSSGGGTELISRAPDGAQANGESDNGAISADGRFVAFSSYASNLVSGDTNSRSDIFLYDRTSAQTTRVSWHATGAQASDNSQGPISISRDGRYVVFTSQAKLTGNDTNTERDVYLYDRGGTTVLVQDEANQPVPGAQVFHNGRLAGVTDANGELVIPNLAFDDTLVARLQLSEWGTAKGHHSADADHNWAYRTYITSLEIPRNGEPTPFHVIDPDVTQVLTLKKANTLIGFNIVASVEWDATQAYLDELRRGFERASTYLYDASDGQMLFEQVTLYDNAQAWNDADYQIKASNQQWPQANVGVIPHGNQPDRSIYLGRYFDGGSANQGAWTQPNGYRTLIHEFGHYGLALLDSYFRYDAAWNKIDAHCTSAAICNNATPGVNATLMYYQFNATEFAMRDVAGLWSADCLQTWQYQVGGSDWETIRSFYSDKSSPARWSIQTPADHGGVVAGPTAIPVADWSQVAEPVNADNEACAVPETLTTLDGDGFPIPNAVAALMRSSGDGRTIWQGKSGANGRITVLGAGDGDTLYVQGTVAGQTVSASWNLTCPTARAFAQADAIILLPDPFPLSVSAWPGDAPQAISVTVQTTVTLAAPPEVFLQQTGLTVTVPLTLTYDGGLGAYVGGALLDPAWPQAGLLGIVATDTLSQRVTTFQPFNLSSVVISETSRLWSPDGRAELYLAPGALSTDGRLNISPEWSPGEAPEGMLILGSPYTLRAEEGLSLVGGANLSIFYEATVETRIRVAYYGAAIYRWDGAAWVALDSTYNTGLYYAAAAVDAFGTYALMTSAAEVTIHSVFLPVIGR